MLFRSALLASTASMAGLELVNKSTTVNQKNIQIVCDGHKAPYVLFNQNVPWLLVETVFLHGSSGTCSFFNGDSSVAKNLMGSGHISIASGDGTVTDVKKNGYNVTITDPKGNDIVGKAAPDVVITLSDS